ncbi:MAG TPA: molybdopterin cofactor-binding domain-containing protein [Kofleriaceae bacterium]
MRKSLVDEELEAMFAAAAQVIDGRHATSPQEQMYIEPQAMMAEWRDGRCHVAGSMQCRPTCTRR